MISRPPASSRAAGLIACELAGPNVTLGSAATVAFALWLNTTCHRRSPDMIQLWPIILATILCSPLCGRSAPECGEGRHTVSSVLTVCGGRLLVLAAWSHYVVVAAPRLCLMSTAAMITVYFSPNPWLTSDLDF